MSKTPFRNYDSPTINSGEHYVPGRSRDPEEIAWRHGVGGTGAVVLRQQYRGLLTGRHMLETVEDPNEKAKIAQMFGGSLLFTARYLFGLDDQDVMRRTLKLPLLAVEGWRENPENYERKFFSALGEVSFATMELAQRKGEKLPVGNLEMKLGRAIGNVGLMASVFPLIRISPDQDPYDIQAVVRQSALNMHQKAVEHSERIGVNMSAAHLADPLSPQGISILRDASDEEAAAYEESLGLALAA